jgi:hypothetical protein
VNKQILIVLTPFLSSPNLYTLLRIANILTIFFYSSLCLRIKEEGDMGKSKGRKDMSPGKKPGPLTKKERKERKKKRKEKQVLR